MKNKLKNYTSNLYIIKSYSNARMVHNYMDQRFPNCGSKTGVTKTGLNQNDLFNIYPN